MNNNSINMAIAQDYKCEHLSSEDTLVVYPCALRYRVSLLIKSTYGTEVKTKTAINVVNQTNQCSYTKVADDLGITDLDVVVCVSGEPIQAKISYGRDSRSNETTLEIYIKNKRYTILEIDGVKASFHMPHLVKA